MQNLIGPKLDPPGKSNTPVKLPEHSRTPTGGDSTPNKMHVGKKPDPIEKESTDGKNSEQFTEEKDNLELNMNVAQQEEKLRKLKERSRVEELKLQEASQKLEEQKAKIAAAELMHVDAEAKACKASLEHIELQSEILQSAMKPGGSVKHVTKKKKAGTEAPSKVATPEARTAAPKASATLVFSSAKGAPSKVATPEARTAAPKVSATFVFSSATKAPPLAASPAGAARRQLVSSPTVIPVDETATLVGSPAARINRRQLEFKDQKKLCAVKGKDSRTKVIGGRRKGARKAATNRRRKQPARGSTERPINGSIELPRVKHLGGDDENSRVKTRRGESGM
jgi:hypothetical protein